MCVCVSPLQMRVTGKNMTNVCKLLFSLAKNEQNDTVFAQERITSELHVTSTCMYNYCYCVMYIMYNVLEVSVSHLPIIPPTSSSC